MMENRTARSGITVLITMYLVASLPQQGQGGGKSPRPKTQRFRIEHNSKDGAPMVLTPGGQCVIGSDESDIDDQFRRFGYQPDWKKYAMDERPRHVQMVKSFLLYQHEVTNEQYKKFTDATQHVTPQHWIGGSYPDAKAHHPVIGVSWDDATAYCRWAGTRLPLEVEWEYAARGKAPASGRARIFPWGNSWDRTRANSASYNAKQELMNDKLYFVWFNALDKAALPLTMPVGSFPKGRSPFEIDDIAGNAWEWVEDLYRFYPGNTDTVPDEDLKMRVVKGGSWANVGFHLRSADRQPHLPDTRNLYIGFRCARDL